MLNREQGDRTNQNSQAELNPSVSDIDKSGGDPGLPNIHRVGKVPIKKTFKPNNVKPADFEGM